MREMVYVSALKVYTTFSCRRFMSDMRFALEKGHITKGCAFSSISNYMMDEGDEADLRGTDKAVVPAPQER